MCQKQHGQVNLSSPGATACCQLEVAPFLVSNEARENNGLLTPQLIHIMNDCIRT